MSRAKSEFILSTGTDVINRRVFNNLDFNYGKAYNIVKQ